MERTSVHLLRWEYTVFPSGPVSTRTCQSGLGYKPWGLDLERVINPPFDERRHFTLSVSETCVQLVVTRTVSKRRDPVKVSDCE